MKKRVILVHGWQGSPENFWFPWLRGELEKQGFEVIAPAMPTPEMPDIETWTAELKDAVGSADENTYFIGHSVGCQTILRYLDKYQENPIGGMVFVAGWFGLIGLRDAGEKETIIPWLESSIDFQKIKKLSNKTVAIFSDNDPFVDLSNKELFESNLGARTIVEHEMGHFALFPEVTELPSVLSAVLEISGNK